MISRGLRFRLHRLPSRCVTAGWRHIDVRSVLYLIAALTAVLFFGCDAFYGKASENTDKSEGTKTMDMIATTEKRTCDSAPRCRRTASNRNGHVRTGLNYRFDSRFGSLKGVMLIAWAIPAVRKQKRRHMHTLGDPTETIQIDYDPSQISYNDLLDIFWQNHDPELARLVKAIHGRGPLSHR